MNKIQTAKTEIVRGPTLGILPKQWGNYVNLACCGFRVSILADLPIQNRLVPEVGRLVHKR